VDSIFIIVIGVLWGGFANICIYIILKNKEGMGLGNTKLIAIICFWFGWICKILVIFSSVVIGLISVMAVLLNKIKNYPQKFHLHLLLLLDAFCI